LEAPRSVFLAFGCLAVFAGCAIDPASQDAGQSSEALAKERRRSEDADVR
jgi:hypothetical protein